MWWTVILGMLFNLLSWLLKQKQAGKQLSGSDLENVAKVQRICRHIEAMSTSLGSPMGGGPDEPGEFTSYEGVERGPE